MLISISEAGNETILLSSVLSLLKCPKNSLKAKDYVPFKKEQKAVFGQLVAYEDDEGVFFIGKIIEDFFNGFYTVLKGQQGEGYYHIDQLCKLVGKNEVSHQ